ncbi:MAG: hypothetical protein ABIL58_23475 [Pseudomonadota bacterium]
MTTDRDVAILTRMAEEQEALSAYWRQQVSPSDRARRRLDAIADKHTTNAAALRRAIKWVK